MIEPGASATITFTCDERSTAIALGSGDVAVLGTPKVVALGEEAAVAAIAGSLADGMTTVGTHIAVDHLAPTEVGGTVEATATVTATDRNRIEFTVDVIEAGRTVARGTHTRVIVERSRFT